jgi:hypothetical protein
MRILISGRNGLSFVATNGELASWFLRELPDGSLDLRLSECSGSLATEISVVPVASNVIIIRGL